MKLRCSHCRHEWDYKGHSEFWACCPVCRFGVKIRSSGIKVNKSK